MLLIMPMIIPHMLVKQILILSLYSSRKILEL